MISKRILIPMAAVAILGAGVYGVSQVSAASGTPGDPRASLIQKLADTFHLDKSKVQAVFDQNRADMQQQHEANYEARLSQAVTDGQLTAAQKDAILAEHNKLAAELAAAQGGAPADRHAAMKTVMAEAKTWAAQNNINAKWLMAAGPGHLRGGRGMGMGMMGDDTPPAGVPSGTPPASDVQ